MIYHAADDLFWGGHFVAWDELTQAGVRAVLCVASDVDICPNAYPMPFLRVPMSDACPLAEWQVRTPLAFLRLCKAEALRPVYVMCRAGLSRSAAFVAAGLVLWHGMSYDEAMDHIRSVRPDCFPHLLPWQQVKTAMEST